MSTCELHTNVGLVESSLKNREEGANDYIITIQDATSDGQEALPCIAGQLDVEQDLSLAEVKDFDKADQVQNPDVFSDLEAGVVTKEVDSKRFDFCKDQGELANVENTKVWCPEEAGYRSLLGKEPGRSFRTKLHGVQFMDTRNELDLIRQSFARDPFPGKPSETEAKSLRTDEKMDKGPSQIHDVLKGADGVGRSLQTSADRLHSLKVPQAVVAFAQAAAKVNDLPGWPLLSPSKPQLQKCDKCSREFCSTLNYRRHVRLHRRCAADGKDLRNEKSQLAEFWTKLSVEEAKEVVSSKNLVLENLSGASAAKGLASFVQQPSLVAYPLAYMRAGSSLLDIVENKESAFPLSAQELLKTLEDASEGTFLCGGTSVIQRFVCHGDMEKAGLEDKNLVASMSLLVEHRLVTAWMAAKDAEALRCEKALVEEEEAAQRKRAKLLEKKRLKKIRQKGSKDKERKEITSDTVNRENELLEEEANSPRTGEDDDYSLRTESSSSSVVSSGHDLHGPDGEVVEEGGCLNDSFPSYDASEEQVDQQQPLFREPTGGNQARLKSESSVDQKIEKVLRERRRPSYFASNRARKDSSDGSYQSNFRTRRGHSTARADSGSQQLYRKLAGVCRGITKSGSGRAVWARKQVNRTNESELGASASAMEVTTAAHPESSHSDILQAASPTSSTVSFEEMSCSERRKSQRQSMLVGSLNVPLVHYPKYSVSLDRFEDPVCGSEEQGTTKANSRQTTSPSFPGKPVKVWRPVSRVEEQQDACEDECEVQGQNKRTHADMLAASDLLLTERASLPNLNVRPENAEVNPVHAPSPTSSVLASFLSQRWATAVGTATDGMNEPCIIPKPERTGKRSSAASKTARIWQPQTSEVVVGDSPLAADGQSSRIHLNTCGKSAGRWHRSSMDKHSQQQYMPRRQVSASES